MLGSHWQGALNELFPAKHKKRPLNSRKQSSTALAKAMKCDMRFDLLIKRLAQKHTLLYLERVIVREAVKPDTLKDKAEIKIYKHGEFVNEEDINLIWISFFV